MINVGFANLGIIPTARGFAGNLQKEISAPVAQTAERVGKTAGGRMGRVWASASIAPMRAIGGAALGLFAVDKAIGFLKGAVAEASNLAEAGNKITTIFGPAAVDIQSFAQVGAKSLGQSTNAVLDGAATFGIYGKAAGLAGQENAAFSKNLVTLAADLASFHNTTPGEAIEALGAALRGEAEPIRAYGVLLDDATLRQEALRLGLIKSTKEALTPQQKVLAANAAIMKQTKVAQGDFAKTSGGLANQQRILAAQWANMKGQLGAALIPALTKLANLATAKVLPAVMTFIDGMRTGTGAGGSFVSVVTGIGRALAKAFGFIVDNRDILGPMVTGLATVVAAVKAWTIAQAALNIVMALNPIGLVVIAVAALVAGLIHAWRTSDKFRAGVTAALNAVKTAAVAVIDFFKAVPGAIVDALGAVGSFLLGVGKAIVNGLWTGVKFTANLILFWFVRLPATIVSKMGNVGATLVRKGVDLVAGLAVGVLRTAAGLFRWWAGIQLAVLRFVGNTARTLWSKGVSFVTGLAQGTYQAAAGLFRWWAGLQFAVLRFVGDTARTLWGKGQSLISGLSGGVGERTRAFFRMLGGIGPLIPRAIGNLGNLLSGAGRDLIQGFINGIKDKFRDVQSTLGNLTNQLTSWKGPHSRDEILLTPAGELIIDGLIRGMEARYPGVKASLGGLTSDLGALPIRSASRSGHIDSARALARLGAGGNQIEINVHGASDPEATARIVGRKLAARGV